MSRLQTSLIKDVDDHDPMTLRFHPVWIGAGVAILSAWASLSIAHAQARPADMPAIHGMLIVGEKTVYLSHLSMFQKLPDSFQPHRFQAIFEVELPNQTAYTSDRAANPKQRIYTIQPAPFVLQSLNPADPRPSLATSFPVQTIERGHFEKDEPKKILVESGNVKIKRVLHFREYKQGASPIPQLRYLLFGKGGELFLAHFINGAPDFDHVLSVRTVSPTLSEAEVNAGILVEIPKRANTIKNRLVDSLTVDAETVSTSDASNRQLRIATGRTLYLEEGELMLPPKIKPPTDEERKAGFP
jgi:hypothetical protein